jgi:hypothetical protein
LLEEPPLLSESTLVLPEFALPEFRATTGFEERPLETLSEGLLVLVNLSLYVEVFLSLVLVPNVLVPF